MNRLTKLLAVALIGFMSFGANAGLIKIDLNNYSFYDELGGQKNIVLTFNLNTLAGMPNFQSVTIDGIGWDLDIETVGDSWLSEASIDFGGAFSLSPGAGDDFSGSGSYSSDGIISLVDAGIGNVKLDNGLLVIELFETFDDVPLEIDAWLSGSITISTIMAPVPLPAAAWFLISGLISAGFIGRRRTV